MHRKQSERVSGNAVEFGEGSIPYNSGSMPMAAGSSVNKKNKLFSKRRIYQLGITIPDARPESRKSSEASNSQSDNR
jgi:hypothetical protein